MAFYGWYMETRRWYMLVGVSTCLCCVGADGGGGGGGGGDHRALNPQSKK